MISSHQPYATLVNKLSSLFSFEEYKEDFFMVKINRREINRRYFSEDIIRIKDHHIIFRYLFLADTLRDIL